MSAPHPTPAVSVCVPVYRGEEHLATTIDSVLAQTFTDFELVIIDNASPDRSGEIAASYDDPRIRVITHPAVLPLTENWNSAVRASRAPLVKLLPDDDLIHPRCLELQVAAHDRRPGTRARDGAPRPHRRPRPRDRAGHLAARPARAADPDAGRAPGGAQRRQPPRRDVRGDLPAHGLRRHRRVRRREESSSPTSTSSSRSPPTAVSSASARASPRTGWCRPRCSPTRGASSSGCRRR